MKLKKDFEVDRANGKPAQLGAILSSYLAIYLSLESVNS